MEYCLVDPTNPPEWTTPAWHANREFIPHYGTPVHTPRIELAARVAMDASRDYSIQCAVELGAGDGSLLTAMRKLGKPPAYWGYEIGPGWRIAEAAGIDVRYADIENDTMDLGERHRPNLIIATEVLEHLCDPRSMLRSLQPRVDYLIASSPYAETPDHHYEYHAWAWDKDGYQDLLTVNGFQVILAEYLSAPIDTQVILARTVR